MNHADLVLRAVAWLRGYHKCSIAFGEIVTAAAETPDAIGWHNGFSRVVECKASRSDFFKDRSKPHMLGPSSGMGRQRWYLTPPGLVGDTEVPEWCGLAYCRPTRIEIIKPIFAERDDIDFSSQRNECIVLASAVRRLVLGSNYHEKHGRFETRTSRLRRERREK